MIRLSSEKTFPGSPIRTMRTNLQIKIPNVGSIQKLCSTFIQTLVDKTKAQKKEEKDKAAKADDAKAGADVGKIVNLMAGDANRVCGLLLFFLIVFLSPHILDRTNNIFALFYLRRYTQFNFLDSLTSYSHRFSAPFELLIGGVFLYQSVRMLSQFVLDSHLIYLDYSVLVHLPVLLFYSLGGP